MSDSVEKARDAMKGRRDTDEAVDRRKIRLNAFIVTVGLNSSQPEKANLMTTRFFALRHFSAASHVPCVGSIFRGLCDCQFPLDQSNFSHFLVGIEDELNLEKN